MRRASGQCATQREKVKTDTGHKERHSKARAMLLLTAVLGPKGRGWGGRKGLQGAQTQKRWFNTPNLATTHTGRTGSSSNRPTTPLHLSRRRSFLPIQKKRPHPSSRANTWRNTLATLPSPSRNANGGSSFRGGGSAGHNQQGTDGTPCANWLK